MIQILINLLDAIQGSTQVGGCILIRISFAGFPTLVALKPKKRNGLNTENVLYSTVSYCTLLQLSLLSVWPRTGQPGDRGSIPGRGERIFPLASVSRPALGPTQPPVRWVPGVLSPGVKRDRSLTLITHPI
jgi:hypothetical protein